MAYGLLSGMSRQDSLTSTKKHEIQSSTTSESGDTLKSKMEIDTEGSGKTNQDHNKSYQWYFLKDGLVSVDAVKLHMKKMLTKAWGSTELSNNILAISEATVDKWHVLRLDLV